MAKRISKAKLQEAEFVRAIDKFTTVKNCVLCGEKMTSACNSHVVPQFILKEIAENGHVSYGHALHTININGLDRTTGVKNAYTFRLICKDCDRKTFQDYENPLNLENFDSLDLNTRKKILCEMAIKTHLSHISMKYRRMVARDLPTGGKLGTLEQEGKLIFAERIDMEEHERYIRMLRKFIKSNKNPFVVLYDKVLDYKTKLATQTVINYNYDLTGKKIFDPDLVIYDNECRYFYLMILPQKDKTRILFYIEKEYLPNVQVIADQFQSLSDEDKLHFLFISLLIHDQQFYMAPSFAETIFKKDKKIVKLYVSTEVSARYQSKIKDFRKYTNYLLKEYN
jgi:hypothetical protein